jgi:hypothetical protein
MSGLALGLRRSRRDHAVARALEQPGRGAGLPENRCRFRA